MPEVSLAREMRRMQQCSSSDRLLLKFAYRPRIIHLREKNIADPFCEIKKALVFLSSQKGSAFFDEDDVCDRTREQKLQPV